MSTEKFVLKGKKHVIDKDPDAELDYVADFTDFLTPVGDTIATAEIVETTGGITVLSVAPGASGLTAIAWLSGGDTTVNGQYASATFEIVTNNTPPRIEHKTLYFNVLQK